MSQADCIIRVDSLLLLSTISIVRGNTLWLPIDGHLELDESCDAPLPYLTSNTSSAPSTLLTFLSPPTYPSARLPRNQTNLLTRP